VFLKPTIHVNFKTSFLKSEEEAHVIGFSWSCVNFFLVCAQNEMNLAQLYIL
jgi:hypothetical protein